MFRSKLAVASLMALAATTMAGATAVYGVQRRKDDDDPLRAGNPDTVNTGRRAEKDAAALAKAQEKRERRAAKRMKAASANVELTGLAPEKGD